MIRVLLHDFAHFIFLGKRNTLYNINYLISAYINIE